MKLFVFIFLLLLSIFSVSAIVASGGGYSVPAFVTAEATAEGSGGGYEAEAFTSEQPVAEISATGEGSGYEAEITFFAVIDNTPTTTTTTTSSSSGGGGGGAPAIYVLENGPTERTISTFGSFSFRYKSIRHTVRISSIEDDKVTYIFQSSPVYATASVNESSLVDLDGDEVVITTLQAATNTVKFRLEASKIEEEVVEEKEVVEEVVPKKVVEEKVVEEEVIEEEITQVVEEEVVEEVSSPWPLIMWILGCVIVVSLLIYFFGFKKIHKKKEKK